MRLIDADKLKAHYAWWEGGSREMTIGEAKKDFDTIVDLQPPIEAEPIVRCGECKWWQEDGVCRLLSNNYYPVVNMDDDDYCSRGVRKDEVEE